MKNGTSAEWFRKAETCIAEARRLYAGDFLEGTCCRAYAAMEALITAALLEDRQRGVLVEDIPQQASGRLVMFRNAFLSRNRLHSSLASDFQFVGKTKTQCDESVNRITASTAETCIMHAEKMLYGIRKTFEPVKVVRQPTPEEVKSALGPYTPRR